MKRRTDEPSADGILDVFEQGFGVLWWRAHRPLGDVTLVAIVDRVLFTGVERFPFLAALYIATDGIRWDALRKRMDELNPRELAAGLRFVMVELLTVLGNLTAEILTPALHSELSSLAASEPRSTATGRIGERASFEASRKGAAS